MADTTITKTQQGAYELALNANTIVTVDIQMSHRAGGVQILAHTGSSPVYARVGTTVAAKDPQATIVPLGTWVDLVAGNDYHDTDEPTLTVALISATTATVSVTRP